MVHELGERDQRCVETGRADDEANFNISNGDIATYLGTSSVVLSRIPVDDSGGTEICFALCMWYKKKNKMVAVV
jgi:hypothetical protein